MTIKTKHSSYAFVVIFLFASQTNNQSFFVDIFRHTQSRETAYWRSKIKNHGWTPRKGEQGMDRMTEVEINSLNILESLNVVHFIVYLSLSVVPVHYLFHRGIMRNVFSIALYVCYR